MNNRKINIGNAEIVFSPMGELLEFSLWDGFCIDEEMEIENA